MFVLDIQTVKAFILISELKNFTKAAEKLGTTQATLSVKLKRLEDRLGQRLIERTPRQVKLSAQGEQFIQSARHFVEAHDKAILNLSETKQKLRLGIACHIMGADITRLLYTLSVKHSDLSLEVSLDTSEALKNSLNDGLLDAIIIRGEDKGYAGTFLCAERMGWYASNHFKYDVDSPLPIANLSPHCGVHNYAEEALHNSSIKWKETFIGGGVAAVSAAISAGIAIGVYSERTAPPNLVNVDNVFDLPPLPVTCLTLYVSDRNRIFSNEIKTIEDNFLGVETDN
ncbi:DNA-binding transcriptional regulator, LysR family [Enterovibrio nigricans DSM 22720]|uniref:DNA-binding transcriptional regulator, LysR family n=1 Tax=Enterovibrio nigricans DSM 22720 TaxID=1121868 RepID=A0A1T4V0E5_9GAMM|nr:DNA-binding transcriptional regulator, LysR family [Enterovibrio nigricans DSM 22720]